MAVKRLLSATAMWLAVRPASGARRLPPEARTYVRLATELVEAGLAAAIRHAELLGGTEAPDVSERERAIVMLIAAGRTYKDVAQELGIAYGEVHRTLRQLYHHHGVHTKSALVARVTAAER